MSNFRKAYDTVMGHEGGYSNHPDDMGGETYKGIARKFHGSWIGWKIIDAVKKAHGTKGIDGLLNQNTELQNLVKNLYYEKYWSPMNCDKLEYAVATEVFDQTVNLGLAQATRHVQRVCNAYNTSLFKDLTVDGKMGAKSKEAVNLVTAKHGAEKIAKALNAQQHVFYMSLAQNNPTQRKFLAGGWSSRV